LIRILHISDAHVQVPLWRMPIGDFLGKRLLGAANLRLRRGSRFRRAPEKLARLAGLSESSGVDWVVFSGDCTALGTEPEYQAARSALGGLMRARRGFFMIPGNHDLYLPDVIDDRRFDRHFGELMINDLPEFSVDGRWPMVRLIDDSAALVGVNSAKPNPEPWRASGRVPEAQLEALARVLAHERLRDRFIFVVSHYGPRREDGSPDTSLHGFENGEALLSVCANLKWGALLHGHIHFNYHLQLEGIAPYIFCAGSATYREREGFWLYEVEPDRVRAFRGRWTDEQYQIDTEATVTLHK
jgi:3',5'-cyclic AMP phosphodiesterase CpdA